MNSNDEPETPAGPDPKFPMTRTCTNCPVQYEGEINGRPWYVRARGESYRLQIAAAGNTEKYAALASDAELILDGSIQSPFAAGWMPDAVAEGLIQWGLAQWAYDHPVKPQYEPLSLEWARANGRPLTDAEAEAFKKGPMDSGEYMLTYSVSESGAPLVSLAFAMPQATLELDGEGARALHQLTTAALESGGSVEMKTDDGETFRWPVPTPE